MTFHLIHRLHFEPNPVLIKELRGRMRGPRAFLFLTAVLVVLGLVSWGLFQLTTPVSQGFVGNVAAGAIIGQSVFIGLAFLTLVMTCAIAPSLTADAISGEYQRKTFDLLMATPLSPFTILWGKLLAALSYIALILLAAVPMMSLAYVFGGVTVADLIKAFVVMGGLAVAYAVWGLFFSALLRRTGLAVSASYVLLALCLFGTLFLYAVIGVMRQEQPPNWLLALNPLCALASALVDGVVANPNDFSGNAPMLPLLWALSGGRFDELSVPQLPLWYYTAGVYGWLTLVLFVLTTQLIKPVQRFRFRRLTWALIVLFLIGSLVAALAIYGPFTLGALRAAWKWMTTRERNLVANSTFAKGLVTWHVQNDDDAPSRKMPISTDVRDSVSDAVSDAQANTRLEQPLAVVNQGGKHALRFWNPTNVPLKQAVVQTLNLDLPEEAELKLHVVLRLAEHGSPVCGVKGDECPLMLKLQYMDRAGRRRAWWQGWYVSGAPGRNAPARCRTCENRPLHTRVAADRWVTFWSPDLFDQNYPQDIPRHLDSITLLAAGQQYQVQVAQVNLWLHEGRPLFGDKPKRRNAFWSINMFMPWWLWSRWTNSFVLLPGVQPPMKRLLPPPPTLAPLPRVPVNVW